jgi:bifunctional non-homologous end joining protein LigD
MYEFSLPTKADNVPFGPDWIHEIKYDLYRMMVVHDQDRVRLISRGGHDWARQFPLIVESALKLRLKHFVLDGEIVVLDKDGVSDFEALASRKHDKRAQLYAFDILAGDGDDYRQLPLSLRKRNLTRLLRRRVAGIFPAEYDTGAIVYDLFGAACQLGLEGIVSKRLDRAYSAGKCKYWIKVKNPAHPAYSRGRDALLATRGAR